MEEKKLTDEEIVKALECLTSPTACVTLDMCEKCACTVECEPYYAMKGALDLIHRLQSENETQRKIIEYQDGLPDLVEQQKAEIERLTEENGRISQSYIEVCDINAELQKQVDELKNAYNDLLETCRNCDTTQAVKDTAKDILDKAIIIDKNTGNNGFICIEALTELCKSKGVEVE